MTAGITRLIIQIPKAAACMPRVLLESKPNINTLAVALTGNSVNPMVGNIAIAR